MVYQHYTIYVHGRCWYGDSGIAGWKKVFNKRKCGFTLKMSFEQ